MKNPELGRRKSGRREELYPETKLNIVLEKEGESQFPLAIKESLKTNAHKEINFGDIVSILKHKSFNDFFDTSASYYHHEKQIHVFCAFLPKSLLEMPEEPCLIKRIPSQAFEEKNSELYLRIRFRKKNKTKLEILKEQQRKKFSENDLQARSYNKQKQKVIGEVIQKVALWRKLYTGFTDEKGNHFSMELEKAADEVGIVKKTLDDYLLQIRNGKKYGFNFHDNQNDKIGELRSFVKEKKVVQ